METWCTPELRAAIDYVSEELSSVETNMVVQMLYGYSEEVSEELSSVETM